MIITNIMVISIFKNGIENKNVRKANKNQNNSPIK